MGRLREVDNGRLFQLVQQTHVSQQIRVSVHAPRKSRRRRTGKELVEVHREKYQRVILHHAQSVSTLPRITSTAHAAKPKLLKCTECEVSVAKERRLFSGNHVLRTACAAVRYMLELESLDLCRAFSVTGSSLRRNVEKVLNGREHVDGHAPRSLNDAIIQAAVHSGDKVPRFETPSGFIQDLSCPEKRIRCNQ